MRLAESTWTDLKDVETNLAVVPIGSIEQHGPHAPLSTDVITAETVASAGVERYDGEAVVTPAIPVGIAEEHRHFTGTLWVREDVFRGYVRDVIRSLAHHGWDRIVLVNGHGGNTAALREVAATASRHDGVYAVPFTWFEAVGEHADDMGHGGPLETAMIRHHRPELVKEDRIDDARDGGSDRWGEWVCGVNVAYDTAEFTDNGVVGDPETDNADRGAELTAVAGDALARLLGAVETRALDRPAKK